MRQGRLTITLKGFHDYQHYKNRNPPWIKLHKKVLDDLHFMTLSYASRCLLMLLWLIGTENDGKVIGTIKEIGFRLRDTKFSEDQLKPLISMGFIYVQADASTVLADAHKKCSEAEGERETDNSETQTEGIANASNMLADASKQKRKVCVSWPKGFQLTEKMAEYAKGQGITKPEEEFQNFQDKAMAKNYAYADWERAWQCWCRSPYQDATRRKGELYV